MKPQPVAFSMIATPFRRDGSIDEIALRGILDRMIEAGNGVYIGSGGAGEGHALTLDEFDLIYGIGVEHCGGRVPVYANPPESRTAAAHAEIARRAVAAGVDVVQLYQLDAGHGMRPTPEEQGHYYRGLLDVIDHPVVLSLHANSGYVPPPALLRKLCVDYGQITAINVIGLPATYFVMLRDALPDRIAFYTRLADAMTGLGLGALGTLSAENNLAPHLCAAVLSRWSKGDIVGAGEALGNVLRLAEVVNRWAPSTARWIKMGLRVLDLPGGDGGLRPPYFMPTPEALSEMKAAFDELGLWELETAASWDA